MTRARFVLGSAALGARFDAVREAVITAPRDAAALRSEIVTMRERVRSAHAVPAGLFDVKHSVGGMMDVEFVVQYLVLLDSGLRFGGGGVHVGEDRDHVDGSIVIEDGAWIGAGAIILPNVVVGARSVVGAGSVVTRSVPPGCVVAGNPARLLRRLE